MLELELELQEEDVKQHLRDEYGKLITGPMVLLCAPARGGRSQMSSERAAT